MISIHHIAFLIDAQLNDLTCFFHDSPFQGSVQSSVELSVIELAERVEGRKLEETENETTLLLNKSRLVLFIFLIFIFIFSSEFGLFSPSVGVTFISNSEDCFIGAIVNSIRTCVHCLL